MKEILLVIEELRREYKDVDIVITEDESFTFISFNFKSSVLLPISRFGCSNVYLSLLADGSILARVAIRKS